MKFEDIIEKVYTFLKDAGLKIIVAVLAFIVGAIIIKLIMKLISKMFSRSKVSNVASSFGRSVIKILLFVVLFYIIAEILNVPTTMFVSIISVAGIAVGLSVQSIISDIANGFVLVSSKCFTEDDFVDIEGSLGTVTNIGLLKVTLKAVDNKTITIPNSKVMVAKVINYNRNLTRRLDMEFTVSYDSDIAKVKQVIRDTIKDSGFMAEEKIVVGISRFLDSSIELTARTFVSTDKFIDAGFEIKEKVLENFRTNDITIPFPQIVVNTKK